MCWLAGLGMESSCVCNKLLTELESREEVSVYPRNSSLWLIVSAIRTLCDYRPYRCPGWADEVIGGVLQDLAWRPLIDDVVS